MASVIVDKKVWLTTIIAISAFCIGILVSNYIRTDRPQEKNIIGQSVPNFSLKDTSGNLRKLSEWNNNVLVINFWATWCKPCVKEIPHFVQLQEKYQEQGLQILGIAIEPIEDAEHVLTFARKFNINYPLFVGQYQVMTELAKKLGNSHGYLPYTVITDRQATIHFVKKGYLPLTEAEQIIMTLL